jgi:hypothetical protein
VDVVLDTIGRETQERSWKVSKKGGVLVSLVEPTSAREAAKHGVRAVFLMGHASSSQSAEIAGHLHTGRLNVIVDAVMPLSEARHAHELSESSHVRGKLVLKVVRRVYRVGDGERQQAAPSGSSLVEPVGWDMLTDVSIPGLVGVTAVQFNRAS